MTKRCWLILGLAWALLAWLTTVPQAEEKKTQVIGRSLAPDGLLLRRPLGVQDWHVIKENEDLTGGPTILGLSGAVMESNNKAVQLTFLGDNTGRSPYPVRETAIILPTKRSSFDLDLTLERGRIDLTNRKDKGAARVRVLVLGQPWELTLDQPGTRIALEMFGRWPRGVPFNPNPGPKEGPNVNLLLLVIKGEVQVKHEGVQQVLEAPPGRCLQHWDSHDGIDAAPLKLDELPDWATGKNPTEEHKQLLALREKIRKLVLAKTPVEVLEGLLKSDVPIEREFAVYGLAAMDDLPRLAEALRTAKHEDIWENGVLALRHWIGRGPGQDQKLYHGLIEKRKYTPAQAETVLNLLHSFGEEELTHLETYQLLVAQLGNDELPIRGLAYWHLKRLADEKDVKAIGYNPLAAKEDRDKAQAKWREILKLGKLPPKKEQKKDDK